VLGLVLLSSRGRYQLPPAASNSSVEASMSGAPKEMKELPSLMCELLVIFHTGPLCLMLHAVVGPPMRCMCMHIESSTGQQDVKV
jgi:hypothetical protein